MRDIFISYRREDSSDVTGRIFDALTAKFGRGVIFKDVNSIGVGDDFRAEIESALSKCKVVLVVIGRDWLNLKDNTGTRRIDAPEDFVRLEIEMALRSKIPIIPVLVENQLMPITEDLPSSIRELAFRHAAKIRSDPDFKNDIQLLGTQLSEFVPKVRNLFKLLNYRYLLVFGCLGALIWGALIYDPADGVSELSEKELQNYQRCFSLGQSYETIGRWNLALEMYEKAAVLLPHDSRNNEKIKRIRDKIKEESP